MELCVHKNSQIMTGNVLVVSGSGRVDLRMLDKVARDFGWAIETAHDISDAAVARANRNIVAVLFCRDALNAESSWLETIRRFRRALPAVRLIACSEFSTFLDWPQLCEAGAFHTLWLPLKENEVRQALGFVWEAEQRTFARIGTPVENCVEFAAVGSDTEVACR